MKLLLICIVLVVPILGRNGFGSSDQEWGFVTVREDAHMFWWLFYTTAVTNYTDRPLIIWLQGGPGASSTQYGNFEEIGPVDSDLNPRNTTWINFANIMFVDNPVGTGFSYVENDQFTTNNTQIAKDFVALLQGFYKALPQFESIPLYIFSESYGGKMTAEIALYLNQAITDGNIKSNFKGVGLGDSWISPVDSCLTWAPYLYNLGTIDTQQYNALNIKAMELKNFVENGEWTNATEAWGELEGAIAEYSSDVDMYNVLTKCCYNDTSYRLQKLGQIPGIQDENDLMNEVQLALNISNTWGEQTDQVFSHLESDFMKPVTDIVEKLLNETDIKVAIYNGQLDIIVDTLGTLNWVERLKFNGSDEWITDQKNVFDVNTIHEGYKKKAGNLFFYWVMRSGHMVPKDNPNAMLYILEQITDNFKV